MIEIILALTVFSLVFEVIAAYISFENWMQWKEMEIDTMKARVFLDKSFLETNFRLTLVVIMIAGGLMSFHAILEYLELIIPVSQGFYLIYYSLLPVAMLSLVLMAYMWYKLLNKKL